MTIDQRTTLLRFLFYIALEAEDGSEEMLDAEQQFLDFAADFGWSYEQDDKHMGYCIKASFHECMISAMHRLVAKGIISKGWDKGRRIRWQRQGKYKKIGTLGKLSFSGSLKYIYPYHIREVLGGYKGFYRGDAVTCSQSTWDGAKYYCQIHAYSNKELPR